MQFHIYIMYIYLLCSHAHSTSSFSHVLTRAQKRIGRGIWALLLLLYAPLAYTCVMLLHCPQSVAGSDGDETAVINVTEYFLCSLTKLVSSTPISGMVPWWWGGVLQKPTTQYSWNSCCSCPPAAHTTHPSCISIYYVWKLHFKKSTCKNAWFCYHDNTVFLSLDSAF